MNDTGSNLKSAVVFWALTSISGRPWQYVCLTVAFIFLAVRHQGPVKRFSMLEDVIRTTEEILEHVKAALSGTRHQMELNDAGCRLLQVKFSASMIRSHILEIHTLTWKIYLQSIRTILRAIDQCASEVKDIQTAMLVRIFAFNIARLKNKQSQLMVEEERRRKLTDGIQDSQDALTAVVRLPTRMSLESLWTYMAERNFKGVHTLRLVSPSPGTPAFKSPTSMLFQFNMQ
ncbi:hypothetical protein B0H19DRAFT_1055756 [Mycena capillaripes]|nr:hypothetical protein B0H19DRAFT_1055756 [Mycena capillaripes]